MLTGIPDLTLIDVCRCHAHTKKSEHNSLLRKWNKQQGLPASPSSQPCLSSIVTYAGASPGLKPWLTSEEALPRVYISLSPTPAPVAPPCGGGVGVEALSGQVVVESLVGAPLRRRL